MRVSGGGRDWDASARPHASARESGPSGGLCSVAGAPDLGEQTPAVGCPEERWSSLQRGETTVCIFVRGGHVVAACMLLYVHARAIVETIHHVNDTHDQGTRLDRESSPVPAVASERSRATSRGTSFI